MPPLWGFLAITVPLVFTPGASTAIVLRNSLSGGTRAGLLTAIGANAGSVCFGLLCAFGFAVALQRWPVMWLVLRVIGIAYLAWLGLQSLWRALVRPQASLVPARQASDTRAASREPSLQDVRQGFLTNVMNPALATFYFVILPQFIPVDASIARTALLLTAVHVTLAASWHCAWAVAGGTLSHVLSEGRPRQVLDLVSGLTMLLLAVRLSL
jgi:threonine/homoserine/homoserine lactone efflux protein